MDFLRGYREKQEPGQEGEPIRFIASTEGIGRDGYVIEASGWDLENYRKNPVVLWGHDYMGQRLPIGKAEVEVKGKQLVADVMFDQQDQFARDIESKYRRGFLNAVSVGWDTLEVRPPKDGKPPVIIRAELLDVSGVPVGGDPDALAAREARALIALSEELRRKEVRGAIPPHSTEKAPEESDWDGPGEVSKAEGRSQLRMMHAWVDEEQDPETKQAYKLPHHRASGEVVWRGVAAAMARLLQAGTQIPDGDRRGVYNHLARHYGQFDKEPPEFRTTQEIEALSIDEFRGLFLEREEDIVPTAFQADQARKGAVLSARNREALEKARDLIQDVLDAAKPKGEEPEEEDVERAIPEAESLEQLHRILIPQEVNP